MIRAVLIDNEPLALHYFQNKLHAFQQIQVMQTFTSVEVFLNELPTMEFEAIFLEVKLQELSGLEVADIIKTERPQVSVIFITAYHEFALQAYEIGSLDYVLKPISHARLEKTVARIEHEFSIQQMLQQATQTVLTVQCFDQFAVYSNNSLVAFKTEKTKELFAYFILHPNIPIHRDYLIEILWPDLDYVRAKSNLHTALSYLRKTLNTIGYENCIVFSNKYYIFEKPNIVCDLYDFQKLHEDFSRLEFPSISLINQCLSIYKNGLFIFDDYEWSTAYKDKLMKSYIELLEKGFQTTVFSDTERAMEFLHALIEYDPYNEQKLEHYLYTLIQAGLHEQALKIFQTYTQRLEEDLALTPSSTLLEISKKLFVQHK
ncbi:MULTISPECIES: response regulator [Lysinibacillus]|uniref:response regulator n=1 Tax=Lysinibacillus TaxID=400634 RepID=UPI0022B9A62B|nr:MULTISPECIES: response regulator [Lysinibacillus]MEC1303835.1 response regulator [Lysinibacillus capsici]WBF57787.1 response regulator [Lysinibacillus sp. JK80]WNN75587.1 response regulator [Lysinibacillus capsici]WPK04758.1 response regulator [Lysinibacillus capsici]